ncbi:MAG: hypothetical protein M3Z04_15710, partial [Chloroflexota bacterium]|nr:hypothetical protein [Chloroflexota bacterium]
MGNTEIVTASTSTVTVPQILAYLIAYVNGLMLRVVLYSLVGRCASSIDYGLFKISLILAAFAYHRDLEPESTSCSGYQAVS